MDALYLSTLMASRLCHDLAAPATSLNYGRELLDEADSPEMRLSGREMLDRGIAAMLARLAMFRCAYGSCKTGDKADPAEIARLAVDYCELTRVEVVHDLAAAGLNDFDAQLVLNMVIVASGCLPRGGRIDIDTRNHVAEIIVRGDGGKLVVGDYIAPAMQGESPMRGWDARTVQPFFASLLAKNLRRRLVLKSGDSELFLRAVSEAPDPD